MFCESHVQQTDWIAPALIDLISNISSAIARNESTLGIILDLSKVFDTINCKILCHKLGTHNSGHSFVEDQKLSWE